MAVIAVINGKGGAGKSTISSHVAAYCAGRNPDVVLCDLDPQRSTEIWLKLRPESSARIRGSSLAGNFTRPPTGASHVIFDTPSGFNGLPYLRLMMYADAVLIPTAFSIFDRGALESTVRMLQAAPRVAAGKCMLACVGTRIDVHSNDSALLETMLREMGVPYLGAIPAARIYSRCLEQGLTVFDFPSEVAIGQMPYWAAVVNWLEAVLGREPQDKLRPALRVAEPRPAIERPVAQAPQPTFAAKLMRNIPRFLAR